MNKYGGRAAFKNGLGCTQVARGGGRGGGQGGGDDDVDSLADWIKKQQERLTYFFSDNSNTEQRRLARANTLPYLAFKGVTMIEVRRNLRNATQQLDLNVRLNGL